MIINDKVIPEVVNQFNVYDGDGDKLVGVTDEVTIPDIVCKTAEIAGAGIAGSYAAPVIGQYDSIKQDVPFRIFYADMADYMNPGKNVTLNMRAAVQVTNRSTGETDVSGIRYLVVGKPTQVSPGSLKLGNSMGSKVTIEVLRMVIEIDGEKQFELDKINSILIVGGKDLMEKIRKLC